MADIKRLSKLIKAIPIELIKSIGVPDNDIAVFNKYKLFPIELLVKANWNYKEDDEFVAEKLRANIQRIGQVENIQVRQLETGYYEVINGNHRLDELSALDKKFVIAYDHGKISIAEAQRIALETNETRFKSDPLKLSALLKEINLEFTDLDLLSTLPYTEEEFNNLLEITAQQIEENTPDIKDDDFEQPLPEQPKTKLGDLYEMNGHRLLCGNSTHAEDVALLMNGKKAQLLYTDPPYNIKYAEFNKNRAGNHGKDWTKEYCSEWEDNMTDSDYFQFLVDFIALAKANLDDWGHYYIWHASTYYRELLNAMEANQIPYDKVPIQWVKQVAPLSWVRYKRISEPCIFAGKGAVNGNGDGARWFGPNNEVNIWQINRDHNVNYIHPTQKPVALCARALNNSTQRGDLVLDLFMGSGTTFIASDMLNRIAYGMELEPKFCDVIVQRFFKYCQENDKACDVKLNGNSININYFEVSDAAR